MSETLWYKNKLIFYLLITFSAAGYYGLCYQTGREYFYQVFGLYSFLFAAFYLLYRFFSAGHFKYLLIAGISFRLLLLFSVPNLSDDVYRFIWDGRLAANGINPFSHLPGEIMQMPAVTGITKELFGLLNSQGYYAIYPPVLQGMFWLTAKLFPVNVFAAIVFMKCMIVIVELGTFYLVIQLLKKLSLPKHLSLLYILNPLVITELIGNVHFEGVMIFFVLLSFLFLLNYKLQLSAVSLGLGIATKLVPVLFLPLIINKLGWKKGLPYAAITGFITLALFAALFDWDTMLHMLNSVDLFFRHFEFNASIYYLVRYIGTVTTGYNIIAFAGPALILLGGLIICIISFKEKNISSNSFFTKGLFVITAWYLFSTTIHPWYICLPVAVSIFTPYRYAIIWSYLTTFSYFAYQFKPVKESLELIAFSYLILAGFAFWEFRNKSDRFRNTSQQNI
ncbi:MAG TPA: glycosyltransferase 87 family protein [Sphingobacteriaceae bacterium]|nr:glycosyltransferase 87 family protein [Sphingobacteriaceae bacterium]